MRFVLLSLLFFTYVRADLQSKITSNAQDACYLKNISSGLASTDYSPVVSSQTLRQTIESPHSSNSAAASCVSWENDPYVNVDYETYNVIATMSCTPHQETIDIGGGTMSTYYWTVEEQYDLVIDCQASCEIPKDSNGNNYEYVQYISETDCTIGNLQQLVDANNPGTTYIIDDSQYMTCSSNSALTGCYYKKHIDFGGNTDNNSTDNNSTTDNNTTDSNTTANLDLTDTNAKLDTLATKIEENGQKIDNVGYKIDALGTQIATIGTKIDANGIKIDSVRDAITNTGNYLASELNANGDKVENEITFQGDRLHTDLEALNAKPTTPDINISNNFNDAGIIDAIHQNTDAINEIKDLNNGELATDASFLDTYQTYYDDMSQSIQSVENNVNDLMATIQGDYTPQFGSYNSCTISFFIMNSSKTVNMCRYSPMLRPYFTFVLTIAMLILLIRLHFYLFPKVFKSD